MVTQQQPRGQVVFVTITTYITLIAGAGVCVSQLGQRQELMSDGQL